MTPSLTYQPSKKILTKYARLLVEFALGNPEGIKPGEVVQCLVPDVAKPLALELHNAILRQKAHVLMRLLPTGFDRDFYQLASQEQLTFFPEKHLKSRADLIDHSIGIIADPHPEELKKVDPAKIMLARNSQKQYRDWLTAKENQGQFTWTLALWATPAKAKIANLSLRQYWQQIIKACYLDLPDPIARWREVKTTQLQIKNWLNSMPIEWVHITGSDVDLKLSIGANRIWQGGADRNIPSFELFTSPNWRGTNGWIKFNQPCFRYGQVLSGVELKFEKGIVVKARAKKGNQLLQEMLKTLGANRVGEFSLTDRRLSPITHFMAETLYDENIGGSFGNTHIALGMAYQDCYRPGPQNVTRSQWQKLGFNDSAEHTDVVSTTDRTVTATLTDGSQMVIYKNGQFLIQNSKT